MSEQPISFYKNQNEALANKMCLVPFNEFQIRDNGEVGSCCYGWLGQVAEGVLA